MRHSIRGQVEYLLGPKKAYEFALWGFGEDFESELESELWKRWNMEHGHLYEIHPDNAPQDDLPKMIEIWKKEKE